MRLLKQKPDRKYDDLYNSLISDENKKDLKKYIEELWHTYIEYSDKDFPNNLPIDMNQRLWEMYLTMSLLLNNDIQKKTTKEGPDIVLNSTKKYFIEAICPKRGSENNPNTQTRNISDSLESIVFEEVSQLKLELRIQNAITSKMEKYDQYIKHDIISENDPFIIAISLAEFYERKIFTFKNQSIPFILTALFPIGEEVVKIDKFGNFSGLYRKYNDSNIKKNRSEVSKLIFYDNSYKNLSGIIYCNESNINPIEDMNKNIYLIKNPNAKVTIDDDFGINEIFIKRTDHGFNFNLKHEV